MLKKRACDYEKGKRQDQELVCICVCLWYYNSERDLSKGQFLRFGIIAFVGTVNLLYWW